MRARTKTKDEVIKWLKDNGVYERFTHNISNQIAFSRLNRFTLAGAFIWRHTKEGFDYWNKINTKFIKWYEN